MVLKSWRDVLLRGDIFAHLAFVLSQSQGYGIACERHDKKTPRTSPGEKDWIWTGSSGNSGDVTGIEDCYGREKLEVKV